MRRQLQDVWITSVGRDGIRLRANFRRGDRYPHGTDRDEGLADEVTPARLGFGKHLLHAVGVQKVLGRLEKASRWVMLGIQGDVSSRTAVAQSSLHKGGAKSYQSVYAA